MRKNKRGRPFGTTKKDKKKLYTTRLKKKTINLLRTKKPASIFIENAIWEKENDKKNDDKL